MRRPSFGSGSGFVLSWMDGRNLWFFSRPYSATHWRFCNLQIILYASVAPIIHAHPPDQNALLNKLVIKFSSRLFINLYYCLINMKYVSDFILLLHLFYSLFEGFSLTRVCVYEKNVQRGSYSYIDIQLSQWSSINIRGTTCYCILYIYFFSSQHRQARYTHSTATRLTNHEARGDIQHHRENNINNTSTIHIISSSSVFSTFLYVQA